MACFDLREPSFAALREAPVYFRYGSGKRKVLVDRLTADAIIAVHGALNPENQAKIERMVAGTPPQLSRVAAFAMQRCRIA